MMLKRDEPGEMIDTRAAVAHLLIRHIDIITQLISRPDDRLAESDDLERGGTERGECHGGERIAIVDDQRRRAEFFNVTADGEPVRGGAQVFKDASRPDGVGDALIDTIFQWNRESN